MVALAIQNLLGGKLYALSGLVDRRYKVAQYQHALVKIGNLYIDGDGVASSKILIERWENNSNLLEIYDLVPLVDPEEMIERETPVCNQTIEKLTRFFRAQLLL